MCYQPSLTLGLRALTTLSTTLAAVPQDTQSNNSFTDQRPAEKWLVRLLNHMAASPALSRQETSLVAGVAESFSQGQALQVLSQASITIRDRETLRCFKMRGELEKLLQDNAPLFEQTEFGRKQAAHFLEVANDVRRNHDFDIILLERVFAQAQGMVGLFQELRAQAMASHQ